MASANTRSEAKHQCAWVPGYTLIQWFRIEARTTLSPVCEATTLVGSIGMWQSMQSARIAAPIVFSIPQLCTR